MAVDILIVDDEKDICDAIGDTLEDEGFQPRYAYDGSKALEAILKRCPVLVILDIWLGESRMDGLKVLELIKARFPKLPVIMMSGHGTIETAVEAIKKGAYDFIEKPFNMDRLLIVVKRCLETTLLYQENQELKRQSTQAQAMLTPDILQKNIYKALDKAASTPCRMLFRGAPGTGKSYAARYLHNQSPRAKGPFLSLSCKAEDDMTLMRNLFGEETEQNIFLGALERCHHGTVFLNDIHELPFTCQKKLLKVLQDQSFFRVHGHQSVESNVRFICATNADMTLYLKEGTFDAELYHRLCVVPLDFPKLAERMEDLPRLVVLFSKMCADILQCEPLLFQEQSLVTLASYGWPGNLRELKNVIEWVYVSYSDLKDRTITSQMLPKFLKEPAHAESSHGAWDDLLTLPLKKAREIFEKKYFLAQMSRFSGNITSTAHFVGMERSALHRKLKSLNIYRS